MSREKPSWSKQSIWLLDGTFVELHPEYGTGAWFVVDGRRPNDSLGQALTLSQAKKLAERLVERRPELKRKD